MKRALAACLALLALLAAPVPVHAGVQGSAQAAALIEQSTGRVLFAYNGEEELPMASTTKIMTALCAIENGDLDDVVTIDSRMVGIEGSSIYLEKGEELTVEELLYGLMLRSGNDAAVALALHVSGSVEDFAALMNDKAAQLGLEHTHFVNPHGLPAQGHYTSALDLAAITRAAYDAQPFAEIVSTQYKTIPWKGHDWDRAMRNKNKMLTQYEGANGVKTGYTKAAGRCLVSGAERDGMQLIAVVLNAPDMWNDSTALLDYGFENFSMRTAVEEGEELAQIPCTFSKESVPLLAQRASVLPLGEGETPWVRLETPENIAQSVAQGEVLGYAILGIEEEELDRIPLVAGADARVPLARRWLDSVRRVLENWMVQP